MQQGKIVWAYNVAKMLQTIDVWLVVTSKVFPICVGESRDKRESEPVRKTRRASR